MCVILLLANVLLAASTGVMRMEVGPFGNTRQDLSPVKFISRLGRAQNDEEDPMGE